MRWQGRRQSENVEDRRRMGRPVMLAGGGVGTLVIVVVALLFGVNPQRLLQQGGQAPPGGAAVNPEEDQLAQFVSVVLADTEDVWNRLFAEMGEQYREPTLVLFTGQVESACGRATDSVGPFYCPADQKLYIDLGFYRELKERLGAPGDFAQAYVIAHEVGHHVQNLLGTSDKVHAMQQRVGEAEANELSVRLELQADFYAGVWAHHAQQMKDMLEEGDIEEAMNAAEAIGDDRLQQQAQGYVVPDSFTHGTSEQRMRWFQRGFRTGDMTQGDTFSAQAL